MTGSRAALALVVFAVGALAQDRVRPPGDLPCSRDELTSYTGAVLKYERTDARISVTIRTDWDTTEGAAVKVAKGESPAKHFLWQGGPFREEHWKQIEESPRKLRKGARVTAWVCTSGATVLDWQPPREAR
jgi:hypothetical protein